MQAFAVAAIFMVFCLFGYLWTPSSNGSILASREKGVQSARIDVPFVQEKIAPNIYVKNKTQASPIAQAEPRPDLYLGVRIDLLDPLEITSIREEVLLDIEFAESMKPLDGEFFNKDEKTVTKFVRNLFSLPEVISSVNEFNQIRSAYGKTDDFLEKRELIQRMKACRSQAVRIIDSAIAREKTVNATPASTASKGDTRSVTDVAPPAAPPPKTFQ